MNILILSDSHGIHGNIYDVIEQVKRKQGDIDMLIHCGDLCGDQEYISAYTQAPVHMVSGNCDGFCGIHGDDVFELEGKKIFLTHGHGYFINWGLDGLKSRAIQLGADIVLYGHTHVPSVQEEEGVIFVNPGSVSFPRQSSRKPSYAVLEIDEKKISNLVLTIWNDSVILILVLLRRSYLCKLVKKVLTTQERRDIIVYAL